MLRAAWRGTRRRPGWSGFALGICAGVALAMLVAVVRPLFGPAPGLEAGELVILSGRDDGATGQRQELINQWNATHPANRARIEELSSSADGQHAEMVGRAQSAAPRVDIYNLDVTWTAEFAHRRYIRQLEQSTLELDGFLRKPLETCQYGGALWALPFNTDAGLLFYRSGPGYVSRPPSTWRQMSRIIEEEFDDPAHPRELEAGYAGQLSDYEGLTVNALEAIWDAGGDVVDRDGRVVIGSDAAEEGLSRLAPAAPRLVHPAARHFTEQESRQAFRDGKVLFMRNWPVSHRILEAAQDGTGRGGPNFTFGVTKLPGRSVLGGQNLAIAAGTGKPRAAQALIEFLTDARSQQLLFERGGFAATREIVYHDRAVIQKYRYAPLLLEAIREARARPVTPNYTQFSEAFRAVVREALDAHGHLPDDATDRLTAALRGQRR
jgi:multiple sugar transport system substrate-binding protein